MPPVVRVRWAVVHPGLDGPLLDGLLLDDERERVARAAPARRDRTAAGLLLARLAVADATGADPGAVHLRRRCPRCGSTTHGVPWAERADGGTVPRVSLTRTDGLVAVALADGPVGVDLERPDTRGVPIGDVALASGEPPAGPGAAGVLRTWVRKEAVLKAAGTGLALDPASFRVTSSAGAPEVTVLAPPPGRAWWLADLDLGTGVVGAVAVLRRPGEDLVPDVRERPLPAP